MAVPLTSRFLPHMKCLFLVIISGDFNQETKLQEKKENLFNIEMCEP